MLGAGIEPAWALAQGILSPSRLPVSPPELQGEKYGVGGAAAKPLLRQSGSLRLIMEIKAEKNKTQKNTALSDAERI